MSASAVFTFHDHTGHFSVYKAFDASPGHAISCITRACGQAQPHFEPGEFAAVFIAANKDSPGDISLTAGPEIHGDLAYAYEVTCRDRSVHIAVFEVSYRQLSDRHRPDRHLIFSGTLEEAQHWL